MNTILHRFNCIRPVHFLSGRQTGNSYPGHGKSCTAFTAAELVNTAAGFIDTSASPEKGWPGVIEREIYRVDVCTFVELNTR